MGCQVSVVTLGVKLVGAVQFRDKLGLGSCVSYSPAVFLLHWPSHHIKSCRLCITCCPAELELWEGVTDKRVMSAAEAAEYNEKAAKLKYVGVQLFAIGLPGFCWLLSPAYSSVL